MEIMHPEKPHLVPKARDDSRIALPTTERRLSRRRPSLCSIVVHCFIFLSLFFVCKIFLNQSVSDIEGPHSWIFDAFGYNGPHRDPDHPSRTELKEKLFLSVPTSDSALAVSRKYATHPHLAGSSEDFADAQVMLELFQSEFNIPKPKKLPLFPAGSPESQKSTLGLTSLKSPSSWIDVYYPVLNTPLDRSIDILDADGQSVWSASLFEDGDKLDPDAAKYNGSVPTFHGLSRDGEAEGHLVYANYGRKMDYDELVESGVDLTGKIVICRYGRNFRGLKIEGAEELGAVGVLLYSDPRDDGNVTVQNGYAPYPAGPARNPTSVQRGSVQFISKYPGDPTTPGYPAYENSTRTEGSNIPKIPSLPISWANAERLLEEIGAGGEGTRLTGRTSETTVKMVNRVDTKVTPIWNTMAAIPGHIKDEIVIVGCHHDAWVMGAADAVSGTVSLHEIIKGFGQLMKHGWRPLRTVVFASWDGEEYGLVGSTEWGEDFAEWIQQHVVAYLNVDISVSGSRFSMAASPSLAHLIQKTAQEVPHPTVSGKTLWDSRLDDGPFDGPWDPDFKTRTTEEQTFETGVRQLGSGSDFTVFLQRLGVASSDQGFARSYSDAAYHYHSVYDSQRWMEMYGDPGFHRHVAVAKHLGLLALRLADSIILPLNTTQYSLELNKYLDKVEKAASGCDATLDLGGLRKSINRLQMASAELDAEKDDAEHKFKKLLSRLPHRSRGRSCKPGRFRNVAEWIRHIYGIRPSDTRGGVPHHPHFPWRKFLKAVKRVQRANKKLMAFEGGFIHKNGIKDREWYRNLVVAPGKWFGYGATTFPALTEALTIDKNITAANYEADRLADLIKKLSDNVRAG